MPTTTQWTAGLKPAWPKSARAYLIEAEKPVWREWQPVRIIRPAWLPCFFHAETVDRKEHLLHEHQIKWE